MSAGESARGCDGGVRQELPARLLRFNDLAICPCRRYLNDRHFDHGTLTAKEVFYDTPHPCSAGAGDIYSAVVRPGHHPSHGSIWLYDRYRRQSHCETLIDTATRQAGSVASTSALTVTATAERQARSATSV